MIDLIEYFVNWKEYTPEKKRRIVIGCIGFGFISMLSILYLDEIVANIKGDRKEVSSTDVSKPERKDIDYFPDESYEQLDTTKDKSEGSFGPSIQSEPIIDDIDESRCYITISGSKDLQVKPAHMLGEGVIRTNIPPKRYQVIEKKRCDECPGNTIFYKIKLDDGMTGYVRSTFVAASPKCFE